MSTIEGQVNFLVWLTSFQNTSIDSFVGILDFMGEETFYLLVVSIFYWCISKKIGFRLSTIMMFSLYVNSFLKFYAAVKRPVGIEGVQSISIDTVQDKATYPYDSFPSGHAQGSFTLWSYLGYVINRPLFWVFAMATASLISFSRLYAGLHWPTDVIGGMVIGLLITAVGIRLTPFITQLKRPAQWGLAVVIPLVLFFLSPSSEAVKTAGFLLGSSVAYLLESKIVKMNMDVSLWKKIAAYMVGIVGAVVIKSLLKSLLPEAFISDFIRYAAMGLWVFLIAPWIFVVIRLYTSDPIKTIQSTGIPK